MAKRKSNSANVSEQEPAHETVEPEVINPTEEELSP